MLEGCRTPNTQAVSLERIGKLPVNHIWQPCLSQISSEALLKGKQKEQLKRKSSGKENEVMTTEMLTKSWNMQIKKVVTDQILVQ